MMRWCDQNGIYYLLGIAKNPVLLEKAQPWTIPAQWHYERTGQKQRLFGGFPYAAATWDRQRGVIIKAEHSHHGGKGVVWAFCDKMLDAAVISGKFRSVATSRDTAISRSKMQARAL